MAKYLPNDPPRCGLISCPSHIVLARILPQIAKSRGDSARCCLAACLAYIGNLAVVLACRTVSGQVCQGLMSLTTRAMTKRLGAAFLLVRALLGSYWPYG